MYFCAMIQTIRHASYMRFLTLVTLWSLAFAAQGADTLLSKVLTFEERIFTVANDNEGTVYVSFPTGVYTLPDYSGRRIMQDPTFSGEIFFFDSLHYFVPDNTPNHILDRIDGVRTKNLAWLTHLPPSDRQKVLNVAVDQHGMHFVATQYHIYLFTTQSAFQKPLALESTRGIAEWNGHVYYNTYSGLYRNDTLIDPELLGGDLFVSESGFLYASAGSQISRIYADGHSTSIDLSADFHAWRLARGANIIRIAMSSAGTWLIGTDHGLVTLTSDSTVIQLEDISIEEIQQVQTGFLLSTSNGLYLADQSGIITNHEVTDLSINQCDIHGTAMYLATEQGLFSYDFSSRQTTPVLLTIEEGKPVTAYSVVKDDWGFLWVGTNAGLFRIALSNFSWQRFLNSVDFNKRSFERVDDLFFMGTSRGVYAWNPKTFIQIGASGLLNENVLANPRNSSSYFSRSAWLVIIILFSLIGILTGFGLHRFFQKKPAPPPKTSAFSDHQIFQDECQQYIRTHLNTVTLNSMCDHFELSVRDLYSLVKSTSGKTPGQLIREMRKEVILQRISESPNIDLAKLAEEVGYSERHIKNLLDDEDGKLITN